MSDLCRSMVSLLHRPRLVYVSVSVRRLRMHSNLGLKVAGPRLRPKDRNVNCMANGNNTSLLLRAFLTDYSPFGGDHGIQCLFGYSVPMLRIKVHTTCALSHKYQKQTQFRRSFERSCNRISLRSVPIILRNFKGRDTKHCIPYNMRKIWLKCMHQWVPGRSVENGQFMSAWATSMTKPNSQPY